MSITMLIAGHRNSHKLVILTQVTSIDDGVDELAWVRLEVSAPLYTADALEAEGIPYATRCNVCFIYKVEHGISVALHMY